MNLKKLRAEDVVELRKYHIFLVEYSADYLEELYSKFENLPLPSGILDDKKRNQKEQVFRGHSFPVIPIEKVTSLPRKSVIIITTGYYMDDYEKLQQYLPVPNVEDTIYYFANRDTDYYETYKEKYQDCTLENIILFRSGPSVNSYVYGMDYADNARALFEHMLAMGYNRIYELIWFVKNPLEFHAIEKNYENVHFLPYSGSVTDDEGIREAYYRALCLAKYIFFTDAYGFCRYPRNGQVRVQLWHGCGFKTRVNFARCEKRYEVTTVVSKLYAKIHADIYGLRDEQCLVTGYAKEDWLFHPVEDWKERLNIPRAEKYIFWLPTFRKAVSVLSDLNEKMPRNQTGLPIIDRYEDLERINETLRIKDAVMIVKLHPFQDKNVIGSNAYSNIIILDNDAIYDAGMQINQILGHADALISDYSSAAVDYLLLDRPIGFTLDDVEEYKRSRGFVFESIKDWLPGVEIYDLNDFAKYINDVIDGNDIADDKRERIRQKMHTYNDDQSCKRILEALHIT